MSLLKRHPCCYKLELRCPWTGSCHLLDTHLSRKCLCQDGKGLALPQPVSPSTAMLVMQSHIHVRQSFPRVLHTICCRDPVCGPFTRRLQLAQWSIARPVPCTGFIPIAAEPYRVSQKRHSLAHERGHGLCRMTPMDHERFSRNDHEVQYSDFPERASRSG